MLTDLQDSGGVLDELILLHIFEEIWSFGIHYTALLTGLQDMPKYCWIIAQFDI